MLWVNLPLVGTVYSQSNKFVMGVKIKEIGDSKLNPSSPNIDENEISLYINTTSSNISLSDENKGSDHQG